MSVGFNELAVQCAAQTVKGERCRNPAVKGDRFCYQHGGRSVAKQEMVLYGAGRYLMKMRPSEMREIEALQSTSDLLDLSSLIGVVDWLIGQHLPVLRKAERQARKEKATRSDLDWLREQRGFLERLIELRRKSVDSERRRWEVMSAMMSMQDANNLIAKIIHVMREVIDDDITRGKIVAELTQVLPTERDQ